MIGPFSPCSLRGMFYQEGWLIFCNKFDRMSGLMREVVRSMMEQSTIVNWGVNQLDSHFTHCLIVRIV